MRAKRRADEAHGPRSRRRVLGAGFHGLSKRIAEAKDGGGDSSYYQVDFNFSICICKDLILRAISSLNESLPIKLGYWPAVSCNTGRQDLAL